MIAAAMRSRQPHATDSLRYSSALAAAKERATRARIVALRADRPVLLDARVRLAP
jgi:hypothetical protein